MTNAALSAPETDGPSHTPGDVASPRPGERILAAGLLLLSVVMALGAYRLHPRIGSAAVVMAILTGLRPAWGIAAFLVMLPVCGNMPGTPQTWTLVLLGSALNIGLCARWLAAPAAAGRDGSQVARPAFYPAIGVLLALYGVVSALSLTTLPFPEMWHELRATAGASGGGLAGVVQLLRAQENDTIYSVYSVVMTLYAIALAVFMGRETRATPAAGVLFGGALLAGLTLSLVAGLLDFYYFIDLRPLRSLDPVVNPGGIQARLQSTFGHSGWFAEYVTMAVPYCMVLLLAPMRYGIRIAAILAFLLIGEFALILTYQRGGWLSYPFVLFVVWLSIYHMASRDARTHSVAQTLRRSFLKIAISLPVTVLVSLALVYAAAQAGWLGPNRALTLSRYADRAAEVANANDRLPYIVTGFRLGTLHPLLGAGSESFSFAYVDEFVRPGGAFYDGGRTPLTHMFGSAHNVYAQTFAGKGAMGLGLLITLILTAAVGGARLVLARHDLPEGRRLLLLMTISSVFAFAAYGMVQEVFYIQSLQYLVFATFGLFGAAVGMDLRMSARLRRALWILVACALGLHLAFEYGYPGHARERNFWKDAARRGWTLGITEIDRQGGRFRWTGARAVFDVPRTARRLTLPLRTTAPVPQTVEVRFNGQTVDRVSMTDHAWRVLRYPLPRLSAFARSHRVELVIDPPWRPPGDGRQLGVMVGPYSWSD